MTNLVTSLQFHYRTAIGNIEQPFPLVQLFPPNELGSGELQLLHHVLSFSEI